MYRDRTQLGSTSPGTTRGARKTPNDFGKCDVYGANAIVAFPGWPALERFYL
jgi:hypothetical protein